jgi:putative ABC transport system substrate-binding protein
VEIIVISSATGAVAAKKATSSVPVVFTAVTDPFEHGLISSLGRPGGNVTGVSLAVGEGFSGKWVELLKEIVPKVTSFSVLWNPTHPVAGVFVKQAELAAQALGIGLRFLRSAILSSSIRCLPIWRKSAQRFWSSRIPCFSIKGSSLRISRSGIVCLNIFV